MTHVWLSRWIRDVDVYASRCCSRHGTPTAWRSWRCRWKSRTATWSARRARQRAPHTRLSCWSGTPTTLSSTRPDSGHPVTPTTLSSTRPDSGHPVTPTTLLLLHLYPTSMWGRCGTIVSPSNHTKVLIYCQIGLFLNDNRFLQFDD